MMATRVDRTTQVGQWAGFKDIPQWLLDILPSLASDPHIPFMNLAADGSGNPRANMEWPIRHLPVCTAKDLQHYMEKYKMVAVAKVSMSWYYDGVTSNCGYRQMHGWNGNLIFSLEDGKGGSYGKSILSPFNKNVQGNADAKEAMYKLMRETLLEKGLSVDGYSGARDHPVILSGRISALYLAGRRDIEAMNGCCMTTLFVYELLDNGVLISMPPQWNSNYPQRMASGIELIQMHMWIPFVKKNSLALVPDRSLYTPAFRVLGADKLPTMEQYLNIVGTSPSPPDDKQTESAVKTASNAWAEYRAKYEYREESEKDTQ